MTNKKLKPCPFCGGEAKLIMLLYQEDNGWSQGGYQIECQGCYVRTVKFAGREFAAACWNVRMNDGRNNEAED